MSASYGTADTGEMPSTIDPKYLSKANSPKKDTVEGGLQHQASSSGQNSSSGKTTDNNGSKELRDQPRDATN
jgi:hypothetical protein